LSSSKATHLVIIPTYNEKENIYDFINEICKYDVSVLIVDDNSPDGTGEIVKKLSFVSDQVNLLSRNSKQGLGSAYRDGFKWGIEKCYKYFIEMDADYSHRFEDLDQLLAESHFQDVVIGSRYINGGGSEGWDMKRKLLSRAANKISRFVLRSNINDMTSGFRCYSEHALSLINFQNTNSDGYSFQIEMTLRSIEKKLSIKEVPIIFNERRLGKSKMSKRIVLEALLFLANNGVKRWLNIKIS
tara:strand:- start:199 stop:927 length:729 start_codon:yes stop_codon:yes gene_type:complete